MDPRVLKVSQDYGIDQEKAEGWVRMMESEVDRAIDRKMEVYEERAARKRLELKAELTRDLTWKIVIALLGGLAASAIVLETFSRI